MVDGKWVNDFSLCMHCGDALEINEDGTKRHYRQPTPCEDCVYTGYDKGVINGKEVDIDPTNPPKPRYHDNGSVTYKADKR
jgi:hypothetical protein